MAPKVEKKPLRGVRVLVGRAQRQASALSSQLRKLGAQVIEIPFIEISKPRSCRPLDNALKNITDYDWLVLTSVNGVEAMWDRLKKLGLRKRPLQDLKIAAIGPATKKAIEQHALRVDVVPKEYVAESVVASLRRRVKGKRVLLARAKVARDVIPRALRKLGSDVTVVEAYETVLPKSSQKRLRDLMKDPMRRPHVVCFTSSSTVKNFVVLLGGSRGRTRPRYADTLNGVALASIGPVTSATLKQLGLHADIEAEEFTIPGLVRAITSFYMRDQ